MCSVGLAYFRPGGLGTNTVGWYRYPFVTCPRNANAAGAANHGCRREIQEKCCSRDIVVKAITVGVGGQFALGALDLRCSVLLRPTRRGAAHGAARRPRMGISEHS